MRMFISALIVVLCASAALPQTSAQNILDAEIAFREMAAEKGLKAAFIEYLAPDGIMFDPDPKNGRELWKLRSESPEFLSWEPKKIEVSANGAIAYSIGNSIYRPNGVDDPNAVFGHYLTVWSRQMNGEYRAVVDAGVQYGKTASPPADWPLPELETGDNERNLSAADSSLGFYERVTKRGAAYAYGRYLADDAIIFRDGFDAFIGKDSALRHIKKHNPRITFAKRKSFLEAGDIAYVSNVYALLDKKGKEFERGNFVQVWRFREGAWKLVSEVFVPAYKADTEKK